MKTIAGMQFPELGDPTEAWETYFDGLGPIIDDSSDPKEAEAIAAKIVAAMRKDRGNEVLPKVLNGLAYFVKEINA